MIWVDPEMCKRSVQIIPGLLKRINNLEAALKQVEVSKNDVYGRDEDELNRLREKITTEAQKIKFYMVLVMLALVYVICFK